MERLHHRHRRDRPGAEFVGDDVPEALERIIKFYEAWDAAEPGKGYAEKAAEWRAKLPEDDTP